MYDLEIRLEEIEEYGTEEDIDLLYYELVEEYIRLQRREYGQNSSYQRFKARQSATIEGRNRGADLVVTIDDMYERGIEGLREIEDKIFFLLDKYDFLDEEEFELFRA